MTFDKWWKENYLEGCFPNKVLESAFKEIAEKAWIAAIRAVKESKPNESSTGDVVLASLKIYPKDNN